MKYWVNRAPEEHTFIVCHAEKIYRLKTREEDIFRIRQQLEKGQLDPAFLGVPESYLRYVEFKEDEPALSLHYGKKTEDKIIVSKEKLRREIFNYLRENTQRNTHEVKQISLLKKVARPGTALLVIALLFGGVIYFLLEAQRGNYYTVEGHNPGLLGLWIGLADLGLTTNLAIFLPLIGLALHGMAKAAKKGDTVERILYVR